MQGLIASLHWINGKANLAQYLNVFVYSKETRLAPAFHTRNDGNLFFFFFLGLYITDSHFFLPKRFLPSVWIHSLKFTLCAHVCLLALQGLKSVCLPKQLWGKNKDMKMVKKTTKEKKEEPGSPLRLMFCLPTSLRYCSEWKIRGGIGPSIDHIFYSAGAKYAWCVYPEDLGRPGED